MIEEIYYKNVCIEQIKSCSDLSKLYLIRNILSEV